MTALTGRQRRPEQPPPRGNARGDDLPRTRRGSPSSLLLTIFGDYWYERTEPLPSAALVSLLSDFGVSEAATRAALSRMAKHGLLVPSRVGRTTGYRLTPRTVGVLRDGLGRIVAFGGDDRRWDGSWSLVVVDDGGLSRPLRDSVRSRMEWLGFARLVDGIWLSPWDRHASALEELSALGVDDVTTLTARVPPEVPGRRPPQDAWDLVELAAAYRAFRARAEDLRTELDSGAMYPSEALVARTKLTDDWLTLSNSDPDLPSRLLPRDWTREPARETFIDTHEALGARAIERVMAAIETFDPGLANLVVHRSFREFSSTED